MSTCVFQNTSIGNVTAQTYTLTIRCTDAGGAFQQVIVNADLGVVPSNVRQAYATWLISGVTYSQAYILITVNDRGSQNGTYVVRGLFSNISSGVSVITMKADDFCCSPTPCYQLYYASESRWRSCSGYSNSNQKQTVYDTNPNAPAPTGWENFAYEILV